MIGRWQFSLRHPLLEMLWISIALGSFAAAMAFDGMNEIAVQLFAYASFASIGAAIGGLFGNMRANAICMLIAALFAHAIYHFVFVSPYKSVH